MSGKEELPIPSLGLKRTAFSEAALPTAHAQLENRMTRSASSVGKRVASKDTLALNSRPHNSNIATTATTVRLAQSWVRRTQSARNFDISSYSTQDDTRISQSKRLSNAMEEGGGASADDVAVTITTRATRRASRRHSAPPNQLTDAAVWLQELEDSKAADDEQNGEGKVTTKERMQNVIASALDSSGFEMLITLLILVLFVLPIIDSGLTAESRADIGGGIYVTIITILLLFTVEVLLKIFTLAPPSGPRRRILETWW